MSSAKSSSRSDRCSPVASGKRRRSGGARPGGAKPSSSGLPGERLQKVLAAAGVASRRECEQLILEGRVQVDGEVISQLGSRVDAMTQDVRIDGEAIVRQKRRYFAVHKPSGVVCTARDPSGRPRVIDLLPERVGLVYNVGRLDLGSEGLILVTNDGELANRLTHPRHGVQKVYEVQVAGRPDPQILAQIRRGVQLAEAKARAVNVRIKSHRKQSTLLEMVLEEGRNREIRRMLAQLGHKVQRLTRTAVGPVKLGDLPRGAYRELTSEEVRNLRNTTTRSPNRRTKASDGTPTRFEAIARRQRKRQAAGGKKAHRGRRVADGSRAKSSGGRGRR